MRRRTAVLAPTPLIAIQLHVAANLRSVSPLSQQRPGTQRPGTLLAKSARFTQRFEDRIGQLCREMTITRVAELNNLSWDQVCRMEKCYMRRLLEQHPPSQQLRTIGVDEISIHKGHTYAIVVADLDQRRPIWLGGQGRT